MDNNEYYAAEKNARKICDEEIARCIKGNRHEIEIRNLQQEQIDMKTDFNDTKTEIFNQLKGINNKFLAMAVSAVIQLVGFFGALLIWYTTSRHGGG